MKTIRTTKPKKPKQELKKLEGYICICKYSHGGFDLVFHKKLYDNCSSTVKAIIPVSIEYYDGEGL